MTHNDKFWGSSFNRFVYAFVSEAAVYWCTIKDLFWKFFEKSQENTCSGKLFLK